MELPQFFLCGQCGHYHPVGIGQIDCRQDEVRFTAGQLDEKYGENQWAEAWNEEDEAAAKEQQSHVDRVEEVLKSPLHGRRFVAYIPPSAYDSQHCGYRVSFVVEGESGHFPTGGGDRAPWYWGPTLEAAETIADDYNLRRGISKEAAFEIVSGSMFPSSRQGAK